MTNLAYTWAEPDLYIMADEELVETSEGAMLRLCSIEKHPDPVIVPDKPWEGAAADGSVTSLQDPFYGSVLYDPQEGYFRCWYNAYNRFQNRINSPPLASQGYACCYATSIDGLNWEKPFVRRVLFDGTLENNVIRFKDEMVPGGSRVRGDLLHSGTSNLGEQVWNVLPYSSPESEDRFVASLYTSFGDPIFPTGITICYSPDGIDWRMHYPPVLGLEGDCHGMSWDPISGCYLLTTRSHEYANLCRRWGRSWKRHIALFRSGDLMHWTAATTILEVDEDDPEDAQLYLMYILPYGHAYLGQLLVFRTHEMVLETQLALSRDLMRWQRVGKREPLLRRGPEGSWDSHHVALSHNPPHPEGHRMRFWYGGKNAPHYQAGSAGLGTGTLRRDGFACWEASAEEGVVTTIPFRPPKQGAPTWLIVNVDASQGELIAEITDADGSPLEGVTRADCEPIRGDHLRAIVNFRAGPGEYFHRGNFLRFGQDIRFRFYLRNAKLYAFKAPNYAPIWKT